MSLRDDFVNNAQMEVDNNSIYVWGGQGEKTEGLSIKTLESLENSNHANIKRILKHISDIYPDTNKSRAFDCSGLVTYHLMKLGLITYDTTANGLYKWCKSITKKELKRGDLVFKVTDGKAVHVAIYKGDGMLIESVGRDEGVKNTELTSKFNKYGRIPSLLYII